VANIGNHAFARDYERECPDTWHIINDQVNTDSNGQPVAPRRSNTLHVACIALFCETALAHACVRVGAKAHGEDLGFQHKANTLFVDRQSPQTLNQVHSQQSTPVAGWLDAACLERLLKSRAAGSRDCGPCALFLGPPQNKLQQIKQNGAREGVQNPTDTFTVSSPNFWVLESA
jgi:hypothetical protein